MIYATSVYWKDECSIMFSKGTWKVVEQIIDCSPWVLYILFIVLFFTIWSTIMVIVQLYQIMFSALQLRERVNLQMQNAITAQSLLRQTPYNRGFLQNLTDFFHCQCFGLIKSTPIDWTKQYHGAFHTSKMRNAREV
ncbi:hypothetical protein GDO86_019778 [Hymenochirus boettgeri]|nr:hypothetical protein GDO86_019778 [Hymenochirus boettgeri]